MQTQKKLIPPVLQPVAKEVTKVFLTWAKLIARIYEVNPLICRCDKEIKISPGLAGQQIHLILILFQIFWIIIHKKIQKFGKKDDRSKVLTHSKINDSDNIKIIF